MAFLWIFLISCTSSHLPVPSANPLSKLILLCLSLQLMSFNFFISDKTSGDQISFCSFQQGKLTECHVWKIIYLEFLFHLLLIKLFTSLELKYLVTACPCLHPVSLQGASPMACTALSTLPVLFHFTSLHCSHCHIWMHLCVCHCDDSVAGNLSHSECTCENPNLYLLAFIHTTFLRKFVWLPRGDERVLGTEAPRPHSITTHFFLSFISVAAELQQSQLSHPCCCLLEPSFHVTHNTLQYF